MSTIQEYEFRPPNVRAILWDGTEETARNLLDVAPVTAEFHVRTHRNNLSGTTDVTLFVGPPPLTAIGVGQYLVFYPYPDRDNYHDFDILSPREFESTYRALPPLPEPDDISDKEPDDISDKEPDECQCDELYAALRPRFEKAWSDGADDQIRDLGEHPPTTVQYSFADTTQGNTA